MSTLLRELAGAPGLAGEEGWPRGLAPGAVVGRFRIERELGRGGFGVVYQAVDQQLGRMVAFKAVRPGPHPQASEERLLLEAEAVARLSHPNLVALYDVGRGEQGPYLVLEYLRGQPLANRLQQGPLSTAEALRVAAEACRGLAHAHQNGVVHRDLTPGNVFLCDDGQVKVLDLGLAHVFGRRRVGGGTPGYMAPEQRRGAPEDERTDVFALGVVLYRMLAGRLPSLADGHRAGLGSSSLEVPGLPGLGALLARMLEPDPTARPRDAGEVLPALLSFQQELQRLPADERERRVRVLRLARVRRLALPALGLAALLGAAVALWPWHRSGAPPASVAVLPFADLSPLHDQAYFSDGLSEEILAALARVDGLRVPGRTSSFWFRGRNAKLADIGRELRVATVLEGTVRVAGGRVRITVQLVDVAGGATRWAQSFDRELADVFALEDEIAARVVALLRPGLASSPGRGETGRTAAPEVHALYLQGRYQQRLLTTAGLRAAVETYQRALAIDPGWAPAWAALSLPLHELAGLVDSPEEAAALDRRALEAAGRAVALAPDLPDALSARGILRADLERDWSGAQADLRRALSVNGMDPDARRRYGILLQDLGRLPEALAEVRAATAIDPLGPAWLTLAWLLQAAGEYEEAEAAIRRYQTIAPATLAGQVALGRNQLLRGRPAQALAIFGEIGEQRLRLWGQALAEGSLGHAEASRAALDQLTARHAGTADLEIATAHAWRGDVAEALDWLERAAETPRGGVSGAILSDPFLRSLRGEARFQAVVRSLRLPAG